MGAGGYHFGMTGAGKLGAAGPRAVGGSLGALRGVFLPRRSPEVGPEGPEGTAGVPHRSSWDRQRLRKAPRRWSAFALALAVMGVLATVLASPALASHLFIVNNSADSSDSMCVHRDFRDGNGNKTNGCTLREAIYAANNTENFAGRDVIRFNITEDVDPRVVKKIVVPGGGLPAITDPVIIDGYSQPGASRNTLEQGNNANLLIELNGAGQDGYAANAHGLVIDSGGSGDPRMDGMGGTVVTGLIINGFGNRTFGGPTSGILVQGGSQTVIDGNYIGTDASGTAADGNDRGVYISNSSGNYVGHGVPPPGWVDDPNSPLDDHDWEQGTIAGARNVISGNDDGVVIAGSSSERNRVEGNYIGTDKNGANALGNSSDGVHIFGEATNNWVKGNVISGNGHYGVRNFLASGNQVLDNRIGTDPDGDSPLPNAAGVLVAGANNGVGGNVISGNVRTGVYILGSPSTGNQVLGNRIGTDADGDSPLPNDVGVVIEGASGNVVGVNNVISGNRGTGVHIFGKDATGNRLQGNFIGSAVNGDSPLPNDVGVVIEGASGNVVGGRSVVGSPLGTLANIISGNRGTGVDIRGANSTGNDVRPNSIFSNGGLGIDLSGGDGVTPNDDQDPDSGPNNLQNFPVLARASSGSTGTTVTGTLDSTPGTEFDVLFFSNATRDPSGHGEGQTYLGEQRVTTDANGVASLAFTGTRVVPVGQYVTATATNRSTHDTSEFSGAVAVEPPNTVPVALDQTVDTDEDAPRTITLKANDDENDALAYEITVLPTHGRLYKGSSTAQGDEITGANTPLTGGQVTYKPNANYNNTAAAPDAFGFRANDGTLDSSEATVSVVVKAVNDAPVARNVATATDEDTSRTIGLSATDVDNDSLAYRITSLPTHAKLYDGDPSDPDNEIGSADLPATLQGGQVVYEPDENYNNTGPTSDAIDSFKFLASDQTTGANSESNEATVSVKVYLVNDAPIAADDTATTPEDTPVTIDVLANDSDPDSAQLFTTMMSGPTNGQLTHNAGGSFTYTPKADYAGTDSFTYRTSDRLLSSNTATVSITVEDTTAPKVGAVSPANGAKDVPRGANVSAAFSEKMDPATLTASSFKLFKVNSDGTTTPIANASVIPSADGLSAKLDPYGSSATLLARNTRYKAVVTTGAKDLAGNALDQDPGVTGDQQKEWFFKTGR